MKADHNETVSITVNKKTLRVGLACVGLLGAAVAVWHYYEYTSNQDNKLLPVSSVQSTAAVAPLHSAVQSNNIAEVKRRIAAGADVNAVDNAGKTALTHAREQGHTGVEAVLLQAGAVDEPSPQQENTPATQQEEQAENKNKLDS